MHDQEKIVREAALPEAKEDSVLGSTSYLEGKFSGANISIKGKLKGEIKSSGLITVHKNAKVEATLEAKEVIVGVVIKGNIKAESLEIKESGKIFGNMVVEKLVIAPGAVLKGEIKMGIQDSSQDSSQSSKSQLNPVQYHNAHSKDGSRTLSLS